MKKKPYTPFNRFVFRTPLFPLNGAAGGRPMEDEMFREAIFIASPELHSESEAKKQDADKDKMDLALHKYYLRSHNRCTPFGLFAGCTCGKTGEKTRIELVPAEEYRCSTRPDMNYMCALIQHIAQKPEVRSQSVYYPNDTIYEFGGSLRYVEYFYRGSQRVHRLNTVEVSDYLSQILERARAGATIAELAASVVDDEVTRQEAEEFVGELIDSQLLKSHLEASVTGDSALDTLTGKLEKMEGVDGLPSLYEIRELLAQIDSTPSGRRGELYDRVLETVKKTEIPFDRKFILQTDLYKPAVACEMAADEIDKFNDLIAFLTRVNRPFDSPVLEEFRKAFRERYEGRQVALSEVMDRELGLGFPITPGSTGDLNPFVDGLYIPAGGNGAPERIKFDATDRVMLNKYIEAIKTGGEEIVLDDKDFPDYRPPQDRMPDVLSVMCSIRGLRDGVPQILLKGVMGTATNLISRFCHLDPSIEALAREIALREQEMKPDVILAEIVHLPESRIGNILSRPVLRPHEIHYMAAPGIEPAGQIPVSDLTVSLDGNRIVLRSRKLGKEILPRLSNAHNYMRNSMPIYRFLCELQYQNGSGFWFGWGELFKMFDRLPRVRYKNFILIPQKWSVKNEKMGEWGEWLKLNDAGLLEKMEELRSKLGLAQRVVLADNDNELTVDLGNPADVRVLLSEVKKRPSFQLDEWTPYENEAAVTGPEGVYANEFIFSFHKNKE